ncbi:hypothetical protein JCM8097_008001 [Rhodosporidiobolus ruineniae]
MSSAVLDTCCVCGKKTTNRCSSCKDAGFDLFFCSPQHQKLIWLFHKRVCGKKATPVVLPEFSEDEVQRVCELAYIKQSVDRKSYKLSNAPSARRFSLPLVFKSVLGVPEESAVELTVPLLRDPSSLSKDRRDVLLYLARSAVFDLVAKPVRHVRHFLELSPFYHVANLESIIRADYDFLRKGCLCDFRHYALVLFTLARYAASDEPPPGFDKKFVEHAFVQLVRVLTDQKPFPSVVVVDRFVQEMRDRLQPLVSIGMAALFNPLNKTIWRFTSPSSNWAEK